MNKPVAAITSIEEGLLQGLAAGNRTATEAVYRQHYPIVTHWIAANGGDDADGADIFQEAMVVLFEKAQGGDFRLTCKIGTYLFAIAKHLWYKKLEKRKRQPVSFDEERGEDEGSERVYEDDIAVHEERELHFEQLDAALERIGEPCRGLLKAYYHQDKSMQQIATEFGYTNPDNAKTQKYKCLTRLKKIFFGGAR